MVASTSSCGQILPRGKFNLFLQRPLRAGKLLSLGSQTHHLFPEPPQYHKCRRHSLVSVQIFHHSNGRRSPQRAADLLAHLEGEGANPT